MRQRSAVGVGLVLMLAVVQASSEAAATTDNGLARRLDAALEKGIGFDTVRIEVTDGEARDPASLTVYGSGVGVWDGRLQFAVTEKQVRKALKLLKRSGFTSMPDRVKGPRPANAEEGGEPDATIVVRLVTLSIAGVSKTAVQDNKAYPLESFRELCKDLVGVFRKAARSGVRPTSLEDGLAKVATGTLAQEVLQLMVSAPEQRALPSQEGQGWLLRVENGEIEVRAHTLAGGFGPEIRRPLRPELAREIAGWLRDADVWSLPQNIYDSGYTDLAVKVLGYEKSLQAREFAGRDPAAEAAIRERFRALRDHFEELAASPLKD